METFNYIKFSPEFVLNLESPSVYQQHRDVRNKTFQVGVFQQTGFQVMVACVESCFKIPLKTQQEKFHLIMKLGLLNLQISTAFL